MYSNLEDIIINLINTGIEGEYWDFKQKWHKDNDELLRDILSFANTIHNKDCFLIIGVSDDCEIIGVEDDENRREQSNLLDLLGNCNFAGQNVPKISLETLNINGKEIDILIIFNSNDVPMYISKTNNKQRRIQANYIYSRVGDRNTPMSENSNIYIIEQLWKKRFGLNRDSIELFKEALKDKWNWNRNKQGWYYKFNPEFMIKEIENDCNRLPCFYSYTMCNESTSYYNLQIIYKGTILDEFLEVVLDSGRYVTISPLSYFVSKDRYNRKTFEYRYFTKGTIEYLLYDFLYRTDELQCEETWAKNNFDEVILIFNNEKEKKEFEIYATEHVSSIEEYVASNLKHIRNYVPRNDRENRMIKEKIAIGTICKVLLENFRKEKIRVCD
ncbi:ATP-binding protein [Clostridium perfringens]|uniref:ATP-binding protein n=1 Tax=Clostridium perfringens TaxID=1502 RepID=UPI00096AC43F|nr:ATP-binding protein [Clostridium perfringens]